nr:hypothetical protein BaRGS_004511 [Batillaria attramentaria]
MKPASVKDKKKRCDKNFYSVLLLFAFATRTTSRDYLPPDLVSALSGVFSINWHRCHCGGGRRCSRKHLCEFMRPTAPIVYVSYYYYYYYHYYYYFHYYDKTQWHFYTNVKN